MSDSIETIGSRCSREDRVEPIAAGNTGAVEDLAKHARRSQSGQPSQVDRRLGMTGATKHATVLGHERKQVAGTGQVVGHRRRVE